MGELLFRTEERESKTRSLSQVLTFDRKGGTPDITQQGKPREKSRTISEEKKSGTEGRARTRECGVPLSGDWVVAGKRAALSGSGVICHKVPEVQSAMTKIGAIHRQILTDIPVRD